MRKAPFAPTGQPRMLRYKLLSCCGRRSARARAPASPMPQPRKASCKCWRFPGAVKFLKHSKVTLVYYSLSLWYIAGIYNCVLILNSFDVSIQRNTKRKTILHKFNLDKSTSFLVFACFPPSHGAASPPGSRLHRRPQNTNGSAAPAAPSRRGDERPNCACLWSLPRPYQFPESPGLFDLVYGIIHSCLFCVYMYIYTHVCVCITEV